MKSEFLKGLGKKGSGGIMDKVNAGLEKISAKTEEVVERKAPEGEVDHMVSITEKLLGKEAAAGAQEPDALDSIKEKLGLGKAAETADSGWRAKVVAAIDKN